METLDGNAELGRLLIRLLGAVTPTVSGEAADPAPKLTVSASEGRALVELLAARGITQGELARLLGLEKSTVSRLAGGLEQKGWIERGRDEGNQRYVRLYLTPAGSAIGVRLLQAWQSRQARIIAALTDAERAGLAIGLGGLLRGLVAEGILGDASQATRTPPSPGGLSQDGPAEADPGGPWQDDGPRQDGPRQDGPAEADPGGPCQDDGPRQDGPAEADPGGPCQDEVPRQDGPRQDRPRQDGAAGAHREN